MRPSRNTLLGAGAVALVAIAALGLAMAQSNTTTNDSNHPGDHHGGFFGGHGGPRGGPHEDGMRGGPGGFTVANGSATGRFVTFSTDGSTISNVDLKDANSTHPLFASITMSAAVANASSDRHGYELKSASGDIISIEDSPMAQVRAMSANGTTITITLPPGASIAQHDAVANWSPAGATIDYGNGQKANLVLSQNATLSVGGQVVTVTLGPQSHVELGMIPPNFPYGGHAPGGPGHDGDMRGPPPGDDERGFGGPRDGRGPPR